MIPITIDASVHVNAFNPREAGSETSRSFLEVVFGGTVDVSVFSPSLLVVEVAAAVARALDDGGKGLQAAEAIRALPKQVLVPLTDQVAAMAALLGARYRLRGADAVYAATALRYRATLVSLDRQQLKRLDGVVETMTPAEALGLFGR